MVERRGNREPVKTRKQRIERSGRTETQEKRKQTTTPLGKWLDRYVDRHGITYKQLACQLGLDPVDVSRSRQESISVETASVYLLGSQSVLRLTPKQTERLADIVAGVFERKYAAGKRIMLDRRPGERTQPETPAGMWDIKSAAQVFKVTEKSLMHLMKRMEITGIFLSKDQMIKIAERRAGNKTHKPRTNPSFE